MRTTTLFLIFALCISCSAQKQDESELIIKIDSLFAQVGSEEPGYMVAVVKGEKTIISKGYGMANLEYLIPIESNSAFNIASLSKQFTAAAIATLILDRKISLEDDVKPFFPNANFEKDQMQLKHLIYMTSGINDYYYNLRPNGADWSSLNFFNIDTALQASFPAPLMYDPGSQWSYSNINYMMLTKIVEQISDQSFADFVNERLFKALGMNNSWVNDDIFQVIPQRVSGYNFRNSENTDWLKEDGYLQSDRDGFLQINRNSPHYGGSGVYTTMDDFCKWIKNFNSHEVWGDEFYDLMHKTMKFDHDKTNDAFGLVHGDFNGQPIVWYEGGDWGFSSCFMRFPVQNISVICFSNLGTGNSRKYVNQIADILFEEGFLK